MQPVPLAVAGAFGMQLAGRAGSFLACACRLGLESYKPLVQILGLDARAAEQLREAAYGSHAPRLLVPLEVHPDADGASQLAREVAA